jgi:hypothetical protein
MRGVLAACVMAAGVAALAGKVSVGTTDLVEHARELARAAPLIDGHNS